MVKGPLILANLLQLGALAVSLDPRQSGRRQNVCTIESNFKSSGGKADDSPAVATAFAQCAKDSSIVFHEGVDYNILRPIVATNLSNVSIQMRGNLHLPRNITAVEEIVIKTTGSTNASALYWYYSLSLVVDLL